MLFPPADGARKVPVHHFARPVGARRPGIAGLAEVGRGGSLVGVRTGIAGLAQVARGRPQIGGIEIVDGARVVEGGWGLVSFG